MKKIAIISILLGLFLNNVSYADMIANVETDFLKVPASEYKQKTVDKRYIVYNVTITNRNTEPILLSSDTEVSFVLADGSTIKSEDRRKIYRRTRKRDMARYYSFAIPGAIIGGGITGITFFLGAPIGAAVLVGMCVPTDKAVRTNVKISQDMFNVNSVPIKLEKDCTYNMRIYVPKGLDIKEIIFSNVSFDLNNMYELRVKAKTL